GAVDYLVKPLAPDMVRAKVAVFAELFRQRKRIEQQAALLVQAGTRESDLHLVELKLAAERRYRTLAEAMPHIVWTAQPDGVVDYFNQRWFEYTGLSAEQTAGSWQGAVHVDDWRRCQSEWRKAMASGQMFETECRLRAGADGSYRWHLARALPERSASGQVVSWLGTFTDIEDQKRAQVERDLLYREAVDAVRARDEFLSIASHELRTPLSSLKLQIEMLLRPPRRDPGAVLSPDQTKVKLEMAAKQIDRLSKLIAELMDISKITSGRLQLDFEECDLGDLVRDVAARLADDAANAQSSLEIHARAPVSGRWDRTRMEQVLMNLLTNALKFGAGQPVEIVIEDHGPGARLVVRDHGIGIAPEDVDRIFHRYEQAISSRAYGGMGLGLYIVSQIVKSHGGTIHVESQPGTGSTFIVDLPREPATIQKGSHA
ncbi:MAG: ATP-binding protein, partial [Polyangiaceae bacterium]